MFVKREDGVGGLFLGRGGGFGGEAWRGRGVWRGIV